MTEATKVCRISSILLLLAGR